MPRSMIMKLLYRCVGLKSLIFQWYMIRRDMQLLLAYVLAQDHILKEVGSINRVQHVCEQELRRTREFAKSDLMYEVLQRHPQMFEIFEHVLCAQLLLRQQHHLVMRMAEEGTLTHEDAHHLIKNAIVPSERSLREFVPSQTQLVKAGAVELCETSFDPIVRCVNAVVLRPVDS
jgi:hypothetical protein